MSIHYRLMKNGEPANSKTFRSLKAIRKSNTDGCTVYAFSCRRDALNLAESRLEVTLTQ